MKLKNKLLRKIFLSKKSRQREEVFLSNLKNDLRTLDLGAKSHYNEKFFFNLVTLNTEGGDGVDVVGNAEDLSKIFADNTFDNVLCLSVLEHTKQPTKLIKEMERILKPGGQIIVSVPFIMSLHDTPNDFWRFTRYGVLELFRDWDLIEIKENMDSLESVGYLYHRLFMQTEVFGIRFLSILFFLISKFHYLIHGMITREFGCADGKRSEKSILANCVLGVFRKKF